MPVFFLSLDLWKFIPNQKKVITFKTAPKPDYAHHLESTVSHRVSAITVTRFSGILECYLLSAIHVVADDRDDPMVFNCAFLDQQAEGCMTVTAHGSEDGSALFATFTLT